MSTTQRVGRNEPCPCGSGKKHKACCGARPDVTPEAKRSSAKYFPLAAIGVAVVGGLAFQFLRGGDESPSAPPSTALPLSTPAAPFARPALTPQPPGEPPAGKAWSPEHGHWHDVQTSVQTTSLLPDSSGKPVQVAPESTTPSAPVPQPPGEVPAGKVWSAEHGHWHDAPVAGVTPAPVQPVPVPVDTPTPVETPAPEKTPAPDETPAPDATPPK